MRILSGIQPSGRLHVGNYFGMMDPAIRLQDDGEAFYFIADYHSLTTVHSPQELRENVRNVAVDFLACGLDPAKATFFRQSDVPEVAELSWLLSTVTPMGLLERCHSYKDKTARGHEATHGLFAYPVLMAADILIYDSHIVPVGEDQKQHLEVTRDIALKFNNRFGDTLVIPKPKIREVNAKVPGLDGQKMSKSYNNEIDIFLSDKKLKKQIMGIQTNSTRLEEPKDAENCNVFKMYSLLASKHQQEEMKLKYAAGNYGFGNAKQELYEVICNKFSKERELYNEYISDPNSIEKELLKGSEKARTIASKTLKRLKENFAI